MAACGGFQHIFDPPLSESPDFVEPLSPWKQIKSANPVDDLPISEFFGELRFKESHASSTSLSLNAQEKSESPSSSYDLSSQARRSRHSDSFSSTNSENLSLCTEGLGFESSDDVEDSSRNGSRSNESSQGRRRRESRRSTRSTAAAPLAEDNIDRNGCKSCNKRSRIFNNGREFPPPISCIGWNGRPWVSFKPIREGGRFILKEIRIPTEESLHACRENGRLKLRFVHSDDETLEGDEESACGTDDDSLSKSRDGRESKEERV